MPSLDQKLGLLCAAAGLAWLGSAATAQAQIALPQPGQVYVRAGLAGVLFEPSAKFDVVGQRLPGASINLSDNVTVAGEVGVYVLPQVSLSLTFGVPPVTTVNGTGPLAPLGRLGSVRYGTVVGLIDYHFNYFGPLQPWVGVGPAFLAVFGTTGDAVQNFHVDERWGAAFQVGTDYMFAQNWGLYGSVSQLLLHTDASATLGGVPITAKVDLNPLILQGGVTFRF